MNYGYARVSTDDQSLARQMDALADAGVPAGMVFKDHQSGRNTDRPGLRALLEAVTDGDSVTISSLDRLGRSTRDLIDLADRLRDQGVQLISLKESLDTSTPQGRCFYTILGAFAQMEREQDSERTCEGLDAARRRGVRLGRPPVPAERLERAMALYCDGALSMTEIAETTGVSKTRIYEEARHRGVRKGQRP